MIDWAAFLVVAVASMLGAGTVVTLYALGLRLWPGEGTTGSRPGAVACFTACAAAALIGVYLIVPALHGG